MAPSTGEAPRRGLTALLGAMAMVCPILSAGGCSRRDTHRVIADVPPEIVLLAVAVEVDGTLQFTGLAARHVDHFEHVVDSAPEGARVHLLGYRESALVRHGLPDELTLRASALRVAAPGEPTLPPPDLHQISIIGGVEPTVSSSTTPMLTADWLACPILPQPTSTADLSCFGYYCEAEVSQRGCVLTYQASRCTSQGPLVATLDRAGNATFAPHPDFVACTNDPSTPALAATCSGPGGARCTLSVREPRRPASIATRQVRVEPRLDVAPPESLRPSTGFVHAVAVRGSRAYTIGAGGRLFLGGSCATGSRLHVVDTVRAATVAAVPIGCLEEVVADPMGSGVLAVVGGERPRLLRLDADGRQLASISLGTQAAQYMTGDLVVSTRSNTAAVLFRRLEPQDPHPARVVLVRLDTLSSSIAASRSFASSTQVLGFLDDGRVVVPDNSTVVWYVDPTTGGTHEGPGIDDCTQSTARALVMEGRRAAFAVRSQQDSVSVLDLEAGESSCRRAVYPYAELQPSALARVPWAPGRWLVALDDDRDGPGQVTSLIGVVDDAEWAYTPEYLELGDGPHLDLEADAEGHLWTTEPWSGSLIELSPAP
jgi:hypothetical protein